MTVVTLKSKSVCMSVSCSEIRFQRSDVDGVYRNKELGFQRGQQLNLNRVGFSWPYIIFLTSF